VSLSVAYKQQAIYAEKTFCHEKSPHVCSPRTGRRANFSLRLVFGECEGFKVHDQKEIGIKKRLFARERFSEYLNIFTFLLISSCAFKIRHGKSCQVCYTRFNKKVRKRKEATSVGHSWLQ
jgi:hypothetical protein